MNRPVSMSQVCEQGMHHQCQGHDAIGGCHCPNPIHTAAPADVLHAAVRLLRNPYNCLVGKDLLADLLDAIAADMTDQYAAEINGQVHPRSVIGLGPARADWAAALAVARAQPGIDDALTSGATGGGGDAA